jgi:hypothetical protein
MWFIVVMLSGLMRLLSSIFLSEVWLAKNEGARIGLYFMLGRTRFAGVLNEARV